MKRIGLICKPGEPEPAHIIERLVPWLRERGVDVHADCQSPHVPFCELSAMPDHVDMAVVLGGDGTMLGAARSFCRRNIPLLGVNLGGLGFMTEVALDELFDVMGAVLRGAFDIEERIMLDARLIRNDEEIATFNALNDIIINKGTLARIIDLETRVNGRYVSHLKADGLIVATPTGSTAYSLSAGGPIIAPTLQCLLLTPICPHTLTNRPIVISDTSCIEIILTSDASDVIITRDGIVGETLMQGDRAVITKSAHTAAFIMPHDRDHFQSLRSKLKWGQR